MDQEKLDALATAFREMINEFENANEVELSTENDCCGCPYSRVTLIAEVDDEWIESTVARL